MRELVIPCPKCGRDMVERVSRKDSSHFLACTGFAERDLHDRPRCSATAPLPEYVKLRRAGAAALPGFE